MAQAEHLPIYKASYDLCLSLEQGVRSFSRYHTYTLGTDLRDGARRVLKLVVRANTRRDKVPVLLELREEVEELNVILRLCQDVKALPTSTPSNAVFPVTGAPDHALCDQLAARRPERGHSATE